MDRLIQLKKEKLIQKKRGDNSWIHVHEQKGNEFECVEGVWPPKHRQFIGVMRGKPGDVSRDVGKLVDPSVRAC